MANNPLSVDEQLLDILEPHYWNQGFENGKEAAIKSRTFAQLKQLIAAANQAYVRSVLPEYKYKTLPIRHGGIDCPTPEVCGYRKVSTDDGFNECIDTIKKNAGISDKGEV